MLREILIIMIFLLSGCGLARWDPVQITLVPKVSSVTINIGSGAKVRLTVLDPATAKEPGVSVAQQPEPDIGYRGHRNDASRIVGKGTLSRLGFEIIPTSNVSASDLKIELQTLRYDPPDPADPERRNTTTISTMARAAAYHGNTLVYEHLYGVRKYRHNSLPLQSWIEEHLNMVLSELIGKILADVKLLGALQQAPKISGDRIL